MHDHPTIANYQPTSIHQDFVVDVVSLGSETRPYLNAQVGTWASHVYVRNFWGFTEMQDFDSNCASMSNDKDALAARIEVCKSPGLGYNSDIESFVNRYYGITEGMVDRSKESGWICAQRRIGRALGWLQSQYSEGMELPDVLALVDDDTYLDLEEVKSYMNSESANEYWQPLAHASCVFKQFTSNIPFRFAHGGFGTFVSKDALKKLLNPLDCDDSKGSSDNKACSALKANHIGELNVYEKGMS